MKPSQVVDALNRIAAGIQASRNPDRSMVASAIEEVLMHLAGDDLESKFKKSIDTLQFAIKKNDAAAFKRTVEQLAKSAEKL